MELNIRYTTNLKASLPNFTGRVEQLDKIFIELLKDNSLAILGERRIGKSLLLIVIEHIINHNGSFDDFVDKHLVDKILNEWKPKLLKFKAIRIDISVNGSEKELTQTIYNAVSEHKDIVLPKKAFLNLLDLFKYLNENKSDINFVFLFDEIEGLENYTDCASISKSFKQARNSFKNIEFVFTGAFEWYKIISKSDKNLTWAELSLIYLNSINVNDLKEFLLKPICLHFNNQTLSDEILSLAGNKPILIQAICDTLSNQSSINEPITKYLINAEKDNHFFTQYCDWLVNDKVLSEGQKNLLKLLCHLPNCTTKDISEYELSMNDNDLQDTLKLFGAEFFATIICKPNKNNEKQFSINGEIIQLFGKEKFTQPAKKQKKNNLIRNISKGIAVGIICVLGVLLYFYSHPNKTVSNLEYEKISLIANFPNSLENEEEGSIDLVIKNNTNSIVDTVDIYLKSDNILFYKDTKNNVLINKLAQNQTEKVSFNYKVIQKSNTMKVNIIVNKISKEAPNIAFRQIPIKNFWNSLIAIFSILILSIIKFEAAKDLILTFLKKKTNMEK